MPSQAPTARAVGTRTCCTSDQKVQKRRNTTEKAKTLLGFNPSVVGDTVPAWKLSSPCFWSKDVTLVTQKLREGLWEPPGSWAPPAISLASVCIYIYIYFISIYLSLSCSPRNRGRANSQARGPDGSSCLQGAGAPQGSLTHCPGLHKCFFFLAYILQQYRNSLQYPGAAGALGLELTPSQWGLHPLPCPSPEHGVATRALVGAACGCHHPLGCPSVLPGLVWAGRAGGQ